MKIFILGLCFYALFCHATGADLELPLTRDGIEPRQSNSCECGRRNGQDSNRIVGGQESRVNEFPWRVALFNHRRQFFCTASLLDQDYVMTAAHCTQAASDNNWKIYVSVGDHDLESSRETDSELIKVYAWREHPDYNPNTMDNDYAIMLLEKSAKFSNKVGAVCLPYGFRNDSFSQGTVVGSGWGDTREGRGDSGGKLRKVDLDLISNAQCQDNYRRRIRITDNMMCTYTYNDRDRQGKDTCQGDSGGSIDYLDSKTKRYQAAGVVSFGEGCARQNRPGVYARVTKYLDWTEQITGQKFCGSPNGNY